MEHNRFKNSFAENIFRLKYAQGPSDSWDALAERLVEDVCGTRWGTDRPLMSTDEQRQLALYIKEQKFIPGGRYLYYAGRPYKAFNNCFAAGTKVLSDKGWRAVEELGEGLILSPVDGKFKKATFHAHGKQEVQEIVFAPVRGNSDITYKVKATRTHRWPLIGGTDTYDLRVGDVVPSNKYDVGFDVLGFAHGFVFGDGNANGQLRLCSDKDKKWLTTLAQIGSVTYPPSAKGDPVLYFNQKLDWKNLPSNDSSPQYIASFILGWLAADGSETAGNKLCSINKEAMEWFRLHAAFAGITITGDLRSQIRSTKIGEYEYKDHRIYIQNWSHGAFFSGYKVVSITLIGEEEVYCPFEPEFNQIVIDHNIHTYQCYLLRAEEDTREEWSAVTQRAMACLMTGGGIGTDYSRLRASGKTLSRTGGKSSGPIPLMFATNEIGRNVRQGGSRRSAIYASLNWAHEDIIDFLRVKNWHSQQIGKAIKGNGEPYTHWDAKQEDFNHNAPLDMTNISVNYDDDAGDLLHNPIFIENCKQAMSTGEPGFSFNFGDKKNETLRNACTEVTSEDDSDVCNLGSINLGNIETLDEFKSVVILASKFLVCGTLRADLPYEKVYKVREKNRRLGLGLMGIHEWLLKRGMKYEVTPELREWLAVYQSYSESAANEHCDRLYISHPVAYRAIAPTGSIGILAATTTGIEPLFSVAYKRRFLTDGTKWRYQFVIDAVADRLIREYGCKPDEIDTSYKLARDYERRIKFQADVQDYVDMSISSTINLPSWGSRGNSEEDVPRFCGTLAKYAPRLRGFTAYPDGARGGQPITEVDYNEALKHKDVIYEEVDICDISGKGGTCGS